MIRMTTWPEPGSRRDSASCTWDGRDFQVRAFSATTALARQLVAAGCPDQPWEAYTPTGERSIRGRSLHWWATRVLIEMNGRLKYTPYRERAFPGLESEAGEV